jgi:hypothetical protein
MAVVNVGAVVGGGSLVGKFQAAAVAGGAYADIAGAALNAITIGNKVATLELRSDQLGAGLRF